MNGDWLLTLNFIAFRCQTFWKFQERVDFPFMKNKFHIFTAQKADIGAEAIQYLCLR